MKITIQDVRSVYSNRTERLSKSSITSSRLHVNDLTTAPYAILALRISLGLLFLAHGCLKVFTFTLPGTAQFFESVGLAGWMATPVAISELLGGLLLISGIYTRWVALGLFPILLVATFKVHGANGWLFTNKGGGWEFPAFFAVACLVQFLLGDGAYAIGSILDRQRAHTHE